MKSNNAKLKEYSRKGIIKNTEWVRVFYRGSYIMKYKNKIKIYLIDAKMKFKSFIQLIFKFLLQRKLKDSHVNYDGEISNYNNYEKCRMETSIQMIRDRNLF